MKSWILALIYRNWEHIPSSLSLIDWERCWNWERCWEVPDSIIRLDWWKMYADICSYNNQKLWCSKEEVVFHATLSCYPWCCWCWMFSSTLMFCINNSTIISYYQLNCIESMTYLVKFFFMVSSALKWITHGPRVLML